jgi:hypothetical protein
MVEQVGDVAGARGVHTQVVVQAENVGACGSQRAGGGGGGPRGEVAGRARGGVQGRECVMCVCVCHIKS